MRTLKLFILFIVIKVTKNKKSYCNPQNDFCVVASCQGITTCFQALLCPGVQRLKKDVMKRKPSQCQCAMFSEIEEDKYYIWNIWNYLLQNGIAIVSHLHLFL